MQILIVNSGSSSLKLSLLDRDDSVIVSEHLAAPMEPADYDHLTRLLRDFATPDAVGHRIVHGGSEFAEAVTVDKSVESRLRSLTPLAPLHQTLALGVLNSVNAVFPSVPAVACFDTAFHAHMPDASTTYALPREWRERWNLRRFGFHGLSHSYAARRAAQLTGKPEQNFRVVTCHLGAGASLAAVVNGCSVDTTMGLTPLEGLVMATRSGSLDPGMLLWLQQYEGISVADLSDVLEHRSGLQGLAGTGDMRTLLESANSGNADANLALDVYVHRLRAAVASMAATMNGLDAIVFTGGVGENAPEIRARVIDDLRFLGPTIDSELNWSIGGDREITGTSADTAVFVVMAREDLQMAREVRQLLND